MSQPVQNVKAWRSCPAAGWSSTSTRTVCLAFRVYHMLLRRRLREVHARSKSERSDQRQRPRVASMESKMHVGSDAYFRYGLGTIFKKFGNSDYPSGTDDRICSWPDQTCGDGPQRLLSSLQWKHASLDHIPSRDGRPAEIWRTSIPALSLSLSLLMSLLVTAKLKMVHDLDLSADPRSLSSFPLLGKSSICVVKSQSRQGVLLCRQNSKMSSHTYMLYIDIDIGSDINMLRYGHDCPESRGRVACADCLFFFTSRSSSGHRSNSQYNKSNTYIYIYTNYYVWIYEHLTNSDTWIRTRRGWCRQRLYVRRA